MTGGGEQRMGWIQRGLIYATDGARSWSRTHTQAPTAILIGDAIRVYFGTRDGENRSRVGFVDLDRRDPSRILNIQETPVLDLGAAGCHDEDGVVPSHVVKVGNELRLYYGGVSRGGSVPYRMSVGLAISVDGGLTFTRRFQGPIVDRTPDEPYMTMAPFVLQTGHGWRMWYGSGTGWPEIEGKREPTYAIKTAVSPDGLRWQQPNLTCIHPTHELEANTRPSVLVTDRGYEMWFSYRHSRQYRDGAGAYRIGYAVSEDGLVWSREPDPAGLTCSGQGWNSFMMAYPNVVVVDGRKHMFFNGDGFGRTGFGYATESE